MYDLPASAFAWRKLATPCLLLPALALLPSSFVWSQTTAAAGATSQEWLREQQRTRMLREQLEHRPDVRLQQPTLPSAYRLHFDQAPCFVIDHIVLDGDSGARFQWALAAANQAGAGVEDRPGAVPGAKGDSGARLCYHARTCPSPIFSGRLASPLALS